MIIGDIVHKLYRMSKVFFTVNSPAKVDVRYAPMHNPTRYRGEIHVNSQTCISCDLCDKICPTGAITMKHMPFARQNIFPEVNVATCIFCGLCEDVCPTKPTKSIALSGGRYDALTGGWHDDQEHFWVHANFPESYIESRLEKDEAQRVKKEFQEKQKQQKAIQEAKAAGKKIDEHPTIKSGEAIISKQVDVDKDLAQKAAPIIAQANSDKEKEV